MHGYLSAKSCAPVGDNGDESSLIGGDPAGLATMRWSGCVPAATWCWIDLMDLVGDLRYFVAVVEHRHFGHAADSLGVTQPAVSQGLRRLERRLGLTLVERTPKGVSVTTDGAMLFTRARLIVDDSSRLLDDARELRDGFGGVRWGVIGDLADELVLRCVSAIRRHQDNSGCHTVTAGTEELLAEVRRGALHLAVVAHPVLLDGTDGVNAGPATTLPRRMVLPADHPASTGTSTRVHQLSGLDLATTPRSDNPAAHDLLIDGLRRRGLDPALRVAVTHREVSIAVASGECFGLATYGAPVHAGTVHRRMMVDEVALRVRIVSAAGSELDDVVHAVDRELLRAHR